MNLRLVVVNKLGQGYDIAEWFRSGTFRLGNQENLIIRDNQTRVFDAMTPGARATHVRITWGDYRSAPPPDFPDLGYKFSCGALDFEQF
jgi:hypothetical protein